MSMIREHFSSILTSAVVGVPLSGIEISAPFSFFTRVCLENIMAIEKYSELDIWD
jgi:hypothetical protein